LSIEEPDESRDPKSVELGNNTIGDLVLTPSIEKANGDNSVIRAYLQGPVRIKPLSQHRYFTTGVGAKTE
jgi:hypothetical protein